MKLFLFLSGALFSSLLFLAPVLAQSVSSSNLSSQAKDPGVRAGSVNAGQPISALTPGQLQYFNDGFARFNEVDQVSNGLGPTYNATSCGSCHAQPSTGGTSPRGDQYPNIGPNPQISAANAGRAQTTKFPRSLQQMARYAKRDFRLRRTERQQAERPMAECTHCSRSPDVPMRRAAISLSRISSRWRS